MRKIIKLSYEDWKTKFEHIFKTSCGVHFEDGFMGSFVYDRVTTIIKEIDSLIKVHGDVTYIACQTIINKI